MTFANTKNKNERHASRLYHSTRHIGASENTCKNTKKKKYRNALQVIPTLNIDILQSAHSRPDLADVWNCP